MRIQSLLISGLFLTACNQQEAQQDRLIKACPAIPTAQTAVVPSNFRMPEKLSTTSEGEGALKITISGVMALDNSNLLNFQDKMLSLAWQEDRPDIYIMVSSVGGHAGIGLSFANAMEYYERSKTTVVCTGNAASAATFVLAAGGTTYATDGCDIMLHAASIPALKDKEFLESSTASELDAYRDGTAKTNANMREFYMRTMGIDETCAEYLTNGEYNVNLTSKEALAIGLVDAIFISSGEIMIRAGEEENFKIPTPEADNIKAILQGLSSPN